MTVNNASLNCCRKLKLISQQSFRCRQVNTCQQFPNNQSKLFIRQLHQPPVTYNTSSITNHISQHEKIDQSQATTEIDQAHAEISNSATVSSNELEKFKALASEWWGPGGEFEALRSLNRLRVPLIKRLLSNENNVQLPSKPLLGVNILDVGCGGGILAEPLARLGANVLAIDPVQENIDAASYRLLHGGRQELQSLSYECTTIEEVSARLQGHFDAVVASEVLEHVEKPGTFINCCCSAVKPGGHVVVTTINRNILSTVLVKYAAEYVFRIVPEGTHDEDKFIQTEELTDMLRSADMEKINFRGMTMNPFNYRWSWSPSQMMNYACYAQKPS